MKILCICEGGNVRSVALTQYLKEIGHEAISIGEKYTSDESMKLFKKWADKVIDVKKYLPIDLWHNSRCEDLKEVVKRIWLYEEEHH